MSSAFYFLYSFLNPYKYHNYVWRVSSATVYVPFKICGFLFSSKYIYNPLYCSRETTFYWHFMGISLGSLIKTIFYLFSIFHCCPKQVTNTANLLIIIFRLYFQSFNESSKKSKQKPPEEIESKAASKQGEQKRRKHFWLSTNFHFFDKFCFRCGCWWWSFHILFN